MVELLTNNTNESFKSICDSIKEGEKIDFYVMPIEVGKHHNDPILLSYIVNNEVKFVSAKYNENGDNHSFIPGQKFTAFKYNQGEFVNKNIHKWEKAIKYNGTEFCYGQKIIVQDSIKRDIVIKLGDEFKKNNTTTFRVIIDGASGDSLYNINESDDTIACRTFRTDLKFIDFYSTLTKALALAHEGKNVVFILDSILSMAYSLQGVFKRSIPKNYDALSLIKNLFSLGGSYNGGTLTMICIYNRRVGELIPKNTVLEEIAGSYNASIFWLDSVNIFNQNKIVSNTLVTPYVKYPYVKIFGKKIYY